MVSPQIFSNAQWNSPRISVLPNHLHSLVSKGEFHRVHRFVFLKKNSLFLNLNSQKRSILQKIHFNIQKKTIFFFKLCSFHVNHRNQAYYLKKSGVFPGNRRFVSRETDYSNKNLLQFIKKPFLGIVELNEKKSNQLISNYSTRLCDMKHNFRKLRQLLLFFE